MELGSVATDFEHISYGEEFASCLRYYEQTGASMTADGITIPAMSTSNLIGLHFDVRKRAAPTVVLYGRTGVAASISYIETGGVLTSCSAIGISNLGSHYISGGGGTLTAGGGYEVNYTADAEL